MSRLHLDIHRDDTVQVMSGKDRGKRGVVVRTVPQPGKMLRQGGIVDFESPLDYSNVMLVCNKCDKPTRIRKTLLPNGQKAIVCVNCGEIYERVRNKL